MPDTKPAAPDELIDESVPSWVAYRDADGNPATPDAAEYAVAQYPDGTRIYGVKPGDYPTFPESEDEDEYDPATGITTPAHK